MPKFEITAPDGRRFVVEGPEGSTQEEALAKVQASYQPKTATKQPEPDYNPTSGMSGTDKFLAGAGKAMTDVVRGVGQVVGMVPQEEIDAVKARDKALMDTGAGTAGNITGSVATLLPTAFIPGAGTLAGAAAIGAAQGALAPVASDESRLMNAAVGGAGGVGGTLAARGIARAVQPINQSDAVKKLVSEGVVPTPGQASGLRSVLNNLEQRIASMDPTGTLSNAINRPIKEANAAAISKAVPEGADIGKVVAGRETIERVGDLIDDAYGRIYDKIKGKITYDDTFKSVVDSIPKREGIDLPESLAARFKNLIQDRVIGRIEDGANAETLRTAHNSLGALSRKFRASGDPDLRAFGKAFADAKDELRAMIARQSSGDFKAAMDALDSKNAALKVVEKASESTASKNGVFSPAALARAAKNGPGEMRSLAQAVNDTLGPIMGDSGTVPRAMLPYLLGGGGAALNETMGGPGWLTAGALAPLLYTRPGARYMIGDLFPGQAAASQAIRSLSPYTSVLGMGISEQAGR